MTETATQEKTTYHHGDLRAALVEATRQLIEEKGIDHFSVSDACRRAGVSTAAPYKHFKNKGEMVKAVLLDSMGRHHEKMIEAVSPYPKGSVDRMRAMGRQYVTFALAEPGIYQLRFNQFDCRHAAEVEDQGNDSYALVLQEVADILREDGITEKVRQRAFMLWSMVHGMSLLWMNSEMSEKSGPQDLEAILDEIGNRLLRD